LIFICFIFKTGCDPFLILRADILHHSGRICCISGTDLSHVPLLPQVIGEFLK
jgi:hypothetical protein